MTDTEHLLDGDTAGELDGVTFVNPHTTPVPWSTADGNGWTRLTDERDPRAREQTAAMLPQGVRAR